MGTDPTILLTATDAELRPLQRRLGLRRVRGTTTVVDPRESPSIIAAFTGVGPDRAGDFTRNLLEHHAPGLVCIAGLAGGLAPDLRMGQVIAPGEVIDGRDGRAFTPSVTGDETTLVTVAKSAGTPDEKAVVREHFDADAVDMETAAIAAVCEEAGVPWLCLRAISDRANETLPARWLGLVDATGRSRTKSAAGYALRRPGRIAGLLRIDRITRRGMAAIVDRLFDMGEQVFARGR